MFAGLLTVIVIGLLVESVIFRSIENVTIRRWGMQNLTPRPGMTSFACHFTHSHGFQRLLGFGCSIFWCA